MKFLAERKDAFYILSSLPIWRFQVQGWIMLRHQPLVWVEYGCISYVEWAGRQRVTYWTRAERVAGSHNLPWRYTTSDWSTSQPTLPLRVTPSTDTMLAIPLHLDVQETFQVLTGLKTERTRWMGRTCGFSILKAGWVGRKDVGQR